MATLLFAGLLIIPGLCLSVVDSAKQPGLFEFLNKLWMLLLLVWLLVLLISFLKYAFRQRH